MPTGANAFHRSRYEQQVSGESTYLLAWLGGDVVGHLNVLVRSKYDVVVERLGLFPEMNALAVVEMRWGRGIGSALVRAAEGIALQNGRVGLAVEPENERARALYEHLGYRLQPGLEPVDVWTWIDADGIPHVQQDACVYLLKNLVKPTAAPH